MPFSYPATEIFNSAGERLVVWSQEDYEGRLAEGWLDQPPDSETPASPTDTDAAGQKKPARRPRR